MGAAGVDASRVEKLAAYLEPTCAAALGSDHDARDAAYTTMLVRAFVVTTMQSTTYQCLSKTEQRDLFIRLRLRMQTRPDMVRSILDYDVRVENVIATFTQPSKSRPLAMVRFNRTAAIEDARALKRFRVEVTSRGTAGPPPGAPCPRCHRTDDVSMSYLAMPAKQQGSGPVNMVARFECPQCGIVVGYE